MVGVSGSIGTGVSTPLQSFVWSTNNKISGASLLANMAVSSTPTIGGIFNARLVRTEDLPADVRMVLKNAGVQGISVAPKIDRDAPVTTAFLPGPNGTNGWYTGPVTVTLIPTDIDGPPDIATTSYALDGSSAIAYSGPFGISDNGITRSILAV